MSIKSMAKNPYIGASLIQGGATILSNGMNIAYNEATHNRDVQEQIEAENRANAEWTRRFNLENGYNTPILQAKRLKEAGINPVQSLLGSAPTPSSSGSTNSPDSPRTNPLSFEALNLADIYFRSEELKNDTKVAEAQADLLESEASKIRTDESMAYWEMEFKRRRDERDERVLKMQEEMHGYNKRVASVAADIAEATKDDKIQLSHQELIKLEADISYVLKTVDLTDVEIQDYFTIWEERSLQNELTKQNIELTAGEVSLIPQRLANMKAEELVSLAKENLTIQEANKAIEEAKQIAAYTQEIPENAKVERNSRKWNTYVNGTIDAISSLAGNIARVVGSLSTGGLSELTTIETTTTTSNNTMVGHYDSKGKMKGFDKTTGGQKVVTVTKKSK